MSEIRVLDRAVSEQIAAGEVVTRPAAAVKELVENSIDAGADSVVVEIIGNGIKSIRITDNGCGIPKNEVKTAFLRHATSKLSAAEQLESIATLGFRGEALPSIAAVSRTRMVTRPAASELGIEYVIEGGEEVSFSETGCAEGTTIYVNDIFYNTPARMKFLKKDVSEGNAVQQTLEQLALAYPSVSIRLIRDGKQTLFTPGTGLSAAMFAVLPRNLYSEMLPVDYEQNGYIVSGFTSAPQSARASRSFQYVYVNGRYVKNKTITAAAEEAYRTFSHKGSFPAFVLSVSTSPERVDVNVHPAKTEVRFSNERDVFSAVYTAVKGAVLQYAGQPFIPDSEPQQSEEVATAQTPQPLPEAGTPQIPPKSFDMYTGSASLQGESEFDILKATELRQPTAVRELAAQPEREDWDDLFSLPKSNHVAIEKEPTQSMPEPQAPLALNDVKFVGEAFATYIILQTETELIFMDKHAAHERALFERFSQGAETQRQILLEPIVVELEAEQKNALLQNADSVEQAGFLIEDFGDKAVAVREIPIFFDRDSAKAAAEELAASLETGGKYESSDRLRLIQSISCRAAIKAGDRSSEQELYDLAFRVIRGEIPRFCPHGRPLYYAVTKKELEKKFDRA